MKVRSASDPLSRLRERARVRPVAIRSELRRCGKSIAHAELSDQLVQVESERGALPADSHHLRRASSRAVEAVARALDGATAALDLSTLPHEPVLDATSDGPACLSARGETDLFDA